MLIRKLTSNDFEEFLKLINDFRNTIFTEIEFKKNLKNVNKNSDIWVIDFDNKLIATATIIYEQKFIYNLTKLAHIEDVCVKKEFRGKGYGKILINKLKEEANVSKCYKITLDCNESNMEFYKKCGFDIRGVQMSCLL